ncbi:hypothetical protein [Neisseria weaveri]|uniref:Putative N-6adenine-specific DNA methylase n=1 Tax=Neisseria weaveri TaxID=28091 RepID=A0A3S4ZAF1_9NEIS|nr:hypothetical protein [Neisseria weaveri]EGV36360.1 hypothetical protein l11_17040 [Neisseria weaveri LMG 5135]VEJ49322.1 putative N-6adenine-specific DNA methylase [Neisseria weaveri]
MMPKYHAKAPLPFVGQKRNFIKHYLGVLDKIPGSGSGWNIVDVFGGSGLLAHVAKRIKPDARVIYNDFDNYAARVKAIPDINRLRRLISGYLAGYVKKQRIPDDVKQVIIGEIERFDGYKCHVVLASWFLFSGRQAANLERFYRSEWYFNLPLSDYPVADDYLDGLEIIRQSYETLIPQFSDDPQALLVLDPPYLSTTQAAYAQDGRFGLVDYLKLVNLVRPPYLFFSSTRSEFIDYIDAVVSMQLDNWHVFDHSTRLTVQAKVSKYASYEDNLVYKL